MSMTRQQIIKEAADVFVEAAAGTPVSDVIEKILVRHGVIPPAPAPTRGEVVAAKLGVCANDDNYRIVFVPELAIAIDRERESAVAEALATQARPAVDVARLEALFDCEAFYDLMQAYRHAHPGSAAIRYADVQGYCRGVVDGLIGGGK